MSSLLTAQFLNIGGNSANRAFKVVGVKISTLMKPNKAPERTKSRIWISDSVFGVFGSGGTGFSLAHSHSHFS